jgi:L-alanine-DL-glutamate epimerase-like enolase superfamily enzyme
LQTDEGLVGIGLGGGGVRPQMQGMVDQLLLGQDPRRVQGLWKPWSTSILRAVTTA